MAPKEKVCTEDQIYNPETNRCVDKNGATAKKLYRRHLDDSNALKLRTANVAKMQAPRPPRERRPDRAASSDTAPAQVPRAAPARAPRPRRPKSPNVSPSRKDDKITSDNILDIIETNKTTSFDIEVSPKSWVMPNRAKYNRWIDIEFKRKKQVEIAPSCEVDTESRTINLFPYQRFIKDYIQYASPYRGILLFHGLGTGKTASSVAAAEILKNHMNVTVMLPAALKPNYINEIKTYGRKYYLKQNFWVFVPLRNFEDKKDEVRRAMAVSENIINRHGGVWLADNTGRDGPNFRQLEARYQDQINIQLDNIIEHRYRFISYNGLRTTTLNDLVGDPPRNIFDNRCVIVDEVHNLISRIANGRPIGRRLYNMLFNAKNCKLIFLSGTPIINYPYEIAYLVNLLAGPRKLFEVTLRRNADIEDTSRIFTEHKHVDTYEIDRVKNTVNFTLLPDGFESIDKVKLKTIRSEEYIDNESVVNDLAEQLKIPKKSIRAPTSYKTLPEDQAEFDKLFIDNRNLKIVNPKLFMKRVLGTVSYFSTYPKELYPSFEKLDVELFLTDHQIRSYNESRETERKKESASRRFGREQNTTSGQLYRFYSRGNCTFVFPENIKRPTRPKSVMISKIELDMGDDDTGEEGAEEVVDDKNKKVREYIDAINDALKRLSDGDYLKLENLGTYSPKFKSIIQSINKLRGTALVYSQFKMVEGLGVLRLALNANGYAQFKIKLVDRQWDLDISEEDLQKPKYIVLSPKEDESKILMRIFNSEIDEIPVNIRNKLRNLNMLDNLRGGIIKVAMITSSGAEGISLKNVREVFLVEPYWNQIRLDQVVGRAIRTCSHDALPEQDRNVKVYTYVMKFTDQQIADNPSIRQADNRRTTDQHIYALAKNKAAINNGILELLHRASVDCAINAEAHNKDRKDKNPDAKNVSCFAFPVDIEDDTIVANPDMKLDELDNQYDRKLTTNPWTGRVLKTKYGDILVREETNQVYDYEYYKEANKLVLIGELRREGNKNIIIRK